MQQQRPLNLAAVVQALLALNCIHAVAEAVRHLDNVTSALKMIIITSECRLSFLFVLLLLVAVQAQLLALCGTQATLRLYELGVFWVARSAAAIIIT